MSDPSSNLKCYLVGGAVRDSLLGLPETDRDWVVIGHDASEMKRLGFRQVGKDFPVFLHPLSGSGRQDHATDYRLSGQRGTGCRFEDHDPWVQRTQGEEQQVQLQFPG